MVIACHLLYPGTVTHTDREPGSAFHDAASVFKFKDEFGIHGNTFIDGDEAGVAACFFHEFRHGHAAPQPPAVCKCDHYVMCVRGCGSNVTQEHAHGFPVRGKFYVFLFLRQHFHGVRQYVKDALFRKRLGDIFKGVAGEGVRHEIRAGGQEHKEAAAVRLTHFQCGGDPVHAFHIDIHEHKVKAAAAKRLKKIPCAAEGDCLHRVSGASAETAAELSHPVQVFLFIIH